MMKRILASLFLMMCCATAGAQQITRIPQLPAASVVHGTDLTIVDQVDATSATGYTTRSAPLSQVTGAFISGTPSPGYVPVATSSTAASWANSITIGLQSPTADGSTFLFQNGPTTAYDIYGPGAPAGTYIYGNVRSVITPSAGYDVQNYNAYDAFIVNGVAWNSASVPHGHGALGMEVFARNALLGAASFGVNLAFFDSYLGVSYPSLEIGGELDFEVLNAGSNVTGWSFVLNGVALNPSTCNNVFFTFCGGASVIQASVASTAQWSSGFVMTDGALVAGGAGFLLGIQGLTPTAASQSSGSAIFSITDTGALKRNIYVQGQPNGSGNSVLAFYDIGATYGVDFIFGPTTSSPTIIMPGTGTNSGSVIGSTAAGGGLNLRSTNNGSPSGDFVKMTVGAATIFDCGILANYCTVSASNGINMNGKNIVNTLSLANVNAAGYELLTGAASATAPTLLPNQSDPKAGIGADAAGDVSIITNNSGTATEALRLSGTALRIFGSTGQSTTCTVTAGNTLVFTNGILTSKGANCT